MRGEILISYYCKTCIARVATPFKCKLGEDGQYSALTLHHVYGYFNSHTEIRKALASSNLANAITF